MREGVIGDVYMSRGLCLQVARHHRPHAGGGRCPPGVHYDLWLGPAPKREFTRNRFHYNWHWFWDYGNGDIGNQGIHQMDIARWGLGVNYPTKVSAMGGHFMFDDDQETPNTLTASFEFDEGGKKKMLVFEVRHWITNHEAGIGDGGPGSDPNTVGNVVLRLQGIPGERRLRRIQDLAGQGAAAGTGAGKPTARRQLGELHRGGAQPQALGPERADRRGRALGDAGPPGEHLLPAGPHAPFRRRHHDLQGRRGSHRHVTRADYRAPFVVPEKV